MNCLYCGGATKHSNKFCSHDHKRMFNNKLDDISPVITTRQHDKKELSLIKKFIKGLSKEEKKIKLPVTLGRV